MADAVTLRALGNWNKEMGIAMADALHASMDVIGRTGEQACQHAIKLMAQSAAARTKQAPKLRPIVRNPDERYKTDARRAPFGVFKYRGKTVPGQKYFKPIFRTGEYGRVRFLDKNTLEIKYINTFTGEVHRADRYEQVPGLSIKTDKRRNIGRRGLARQAWTWGLARLGGRVKGQPIHGAYALKTISETRMQGYVLINALRYIERAMKPGWERAVEIAAGNKIMAQARNKLEQRWRREMGMPRRQRSEPHATNQFLSRYFLKGL